MNRRGTWWLLILFWAGVILACSGCDIEDYAPDVNVTLPYELTCIAGFRAIRDTSNGETMGFIVDTYGAAIPCEMAPVDMSGSGAE